MQDVTNAEKPMAQTTIYVDDAHAYEKTIDALSAFIPYTDLIETPQYGSGITVILGNDWVKRL